MPTAQDLHDKLKALAEEFKGTPGLSYHLSQLEGCIGHLRQTIKQQANAPSPAPAEPPPAEAPVAPVDTRPLPATLVKPTVQVAKPQASA